MIFFIILIYVSIFIFISISIYIFNLILDIISFVLCLFIVLFGQEVNLLLVYRFSKNFLQFIMVMVMAIDLKFLFCFVSCLV